MPDVGVRDLKEQASEIVRQIRENRARYIITYRGEPVGLLMPLDEASPSSLSSGEEGAEMP
jgi:prevent-host-death family protein